MRTIHYLFILAVIAFLLYVAATDLETPEPAVGIPIPCETITLDQFNRMKHRRFPHSR